jgi:8-oxo-dGTP pyrophosphatase MutT (NUDIX family)
MSDDLKWRLGARIPAHDYGIFTTAFVEGEHPSTDERKRFSLIECVDWVNVIALTADERVVLIRQFRIGSAEVTLEIPGGMVDPGEDPMAAAVRELREETGYTGGQWHVVGRVRPNPAIQTNWLHTIVADGVELTVAPEPGPGEVIDVCTASLAEVQAKLIAGEIDHALVVAGFAHLAFRGHTLRAPSRR